MRQRETLKREYLEELNVTLVDVFYLGYLLVEDDNNEKYAELKNEYNKILEQNENLTWILEGDIKGRNLSNEECFSLSKLVQIYYDMQSIEEREIFFLGGKESYFFFKK